MPYRLPEGFPHKLTDADADAVLVEIVAALRNRYGDEVGAWLPELQLALLSVALGDQGRRQLVKGGRIALYSLGVAVVALAIALVTLLVA